MRDGDHSICRCCSLPLLITAIHAVPVGQRAFVALDYLGGERYVHMPTHTSCVPTTDTKGCEDEQPSAVTQSRVAMHTLRTPSVLGYRRTII